jgi:hypothetical protein
MLPVFFTFIPFAVLFIYLIPTTRSKILGILYMLVLLFFIWGVGGFVFSGKPSSNEIYVFFAFYIFILGIHVPLFLKLMHINHKKELIKSARKILGTDVKHLSEEELHYRIKH